MNNIVVLGAGFAGLRTALKLEKKFKNHPDYKVILIDKNSYQTYTPSLYEVATAHRGGNLPADIPESRFTSEVAGSVGFLVRDVIASTDITFVRDKITGINPSVNSVTTQKSGAISYKYLVVALGSEATYYNVEGAATCCHSLKTIPQALAIRDAIKTSFEKAAREKRDVNFLVIGAGFSGFEVATEMASYIKKHLAKAAYNYPLEKINIKLLDAGNKIIPEGSDKMRRIARGRLKRLGIELILNAKITKVEPNKVYCESGKSYKADFIVWGGGIKGLELFKSVEGFELHKTGRIKVDSHLRTDALENVFVVGDSSYFETKTQAIPATVWAAEQEADVAAGNIWKAANNKPFDEYSPKFPGFISSAGGKYAIAHIYGITFGGFFAWVAKRLVDLRYIFSIYSHKPLRGFRIWFKELTLFSKND